jgi:hypothetical protein
MYRYLIPLYLFAYYLCLDGVGFVFKAIFVIALIWYALAVINFLKLVLIKNYPLEKAFAYTYWNCYGKF